MNKDVSFNIFFQLNESTVAKNQIVLKLPIIIVQHNNMGLDVRKKCLKSLKQCDT